MNILIDTLTYMLTYAVIGVIGGVIGGMVGCALIYGPREVFEFIRDIITRRWP